MIQSCIEQWYANKDNLQDYFRTTPQSEYSNYVDIVKALFTHCITEFPTKCKYAAEFDIENIVVVDHGDYQGTQIFIIPRKTYQPSVEDYVYTHNSYGSCSGCDTILAIRSMEPDEDERPSEEQVHDYMTLALHLVQRLHKLIGDENEH